MAVINLAINIPDAHVARVQAALKTHYGNPAMTNAEAIEALRLEVVGRIKELVARYEREAAVAAAQDANYDVGAT